MPLLTFSISHISLKARPPAIYTNIRSLCYFLTAPNFGVLIIIRSWMLLTLRLRSPKYYFLFWMLLTISARMGQWRFPKNTTYYYFLFLLRSLSRNLLGHRCWIALSIFSYLVFNSLMNSSRSLGFKSIHIIMSSIILNLSISSVVLLFTNYKLLLIKNF